MVHQSCEMAPPIHLGMWAMAEWYCLERCPQFRVYPYRGVPLYIHTHLEVRAVLGEIRYDCLSQSDSREVQSLYTATVHPCTH